MNKLTVKRIKVVKLKTGTVPQHEEVMAYEVTRVVGSVSPYVGEVLSENYIKGLCDQTGTWVITFV